MFLTYSDDSLPWNKSSVREPDEVWRYIQAFISKDECQVNGRDWKIDIDMVEKAFHGSYDHYHKALMALGDRYDFFLNLLKDPSLRSEYELDEEKLTERLVYAMGACIKKGERMIDAMKDLPGSFIVQVFNDTLDPEFARLNRLWSIGPSVSSCEKTGICICSSNRAPYTKSCLMENALLPGLPSKRGTDDDYFPEGFGNLVL